MAQGNELAEPVRTVAPPLPSYRQRTLTGIIPTRRAAGGRAEGATSGRHRTGRTDAFLAKWQGVIASELSTSQSFLADLCRLLGVDTPHTTPEQDYMLERPITFQHDDGSSAGRIDIYRRGVFVPEPKSLRLYAGLGIPYKVHDEEET